ncbi:hypothetical protein ANO14919_115510 [Xylariales sp. No.14919]|nr:hypothetical protein ANO14919_115510 [Xylariales sp. No.14919]
MIALYIWISLILPYVWGNTEKTVFLGPSPADLESVYPTLDYLGLVPLNPKKFAIRTHLNAEFPNNGIRHGAPSWFVLHNLTEGRRYEARVCWAATQPTAFKLDVYDLETVFRAPELTSELSEYASTLHFNMNNQAAISSPTLEPGIKDSVKLLRILVAADYYTTNHTLMKNVPPIMVDIILDPFVLNILPRSLSSTVTYITVVAIVSWFVGKWISSWVRQIAAEPTKHKHQ